MNIVKQLRDARIRRGTSLRDVARRSGVAPGNLSTIEHGHRDPTSATLEKVAGALNIRLVPVPAGRVTAAEATDRILQAEKEGRPDVAYRHFIQLADDLTEPDPFTRLLLVAEAPGVTTSRWLDAVAGVVELRLQEALLPAPAWVTQQRGQADSVWEPQRGRRPLPVHARIAQAPEPLRRRGVAIEAGELESA